MDQLLTSRLSWLHPDTTYSGDGGAIETWSTSGTSIPANLQRKAGTMTYQVRGQVYMPTHKALLRTEREFAIGDKLNDGTFDYLILAITEHPEPHHHLELDLVQMEGHR